MQLWMPMREGEVASPSPFGDTLVMTKQGTSYVSQCETDTNVSSAPD
jgi:hypothetical protein